MRLLRSLRPDSDRPDPETVEQTTRWKLARYRDLKLFAAKEGDEDLHEFAKNKEEAMIAMLQDEYEVLGEQQNSNGGTGGGEG